MEFLLRAGFGVFGLADKPSLLLGTDVMASFRKVSLDFRERKVRFQLRRCSSNISIQLASQSYTSRLGSTNAADCTR